MIRPLVFYPENHESHIEPGHPERPERLLAIRGKLQDESLWSRVDQASAIQISENTLHAIHSPDHLASLKRLAANGGRSDSDTYLTAQSFAIAIDSAGGAAAIAQALWDGARSGGLALCRPPGHHATADVAMGFCLLNNIALAAQSLIDQKAAQRIAIIDIDLHHGNGTQDIFYGRSDVLFISLHEWPLYPGSGRLTETGSGEGKGFTINLPLPPHSGDAARNAALEQLIIPSLEAFDPEIVLISLGLDAHWRDPLGNQVCTSTGYANLVAGIRAWAIENTGRDVPLMLEGGYDLESNSETIKLIVSSFVGQETGDDLGSGSIAETNAWQANLESALRIHEQERG